jgi:hypothetical protein
MKAVTAQLATIPEPYRLRHGPLLATIETWSDGTVVARMPALALYADAESDVLALNALADEIAELGTSVQQALARGETLGGPLARRWAAFLALVEVPPAER